MVGIVWAHSNLEEQTNWGNLKQNLWKTKCSKDQEDEKESKREMEKRISGWLELVQIRKNGENCGQCEIENEIENKM